jgi:nitroimidazol reductase NimA-like FMN-containing flavoprotein (pyridoxamine 5'-phosphate oxidase superfamily)
MRRKDKEITGLDEFLGVLERCSFLTLGLVEDGKAYMVPLSYGYRCQDGAIEIYFHSAYAGRKIDLLRQNPAVTFTVGRPVAMSLADQACDYTFLYESVMGEGKVDFVEDPAAKTEALRLLMRHTLGDGHDQFNAHQIKATAVLRLTVTAITGKAARKPTQATDRAPIVF